MIFHKMKHFLKFYPSKIFGVKLLNNISCKDSHIILSHVLAVNCFAIYCSVDSATNCSSVNSPFSSFFSPKASLRTCCNNKSLVCWLCFVCSSNWSQKPLTCLIWQQYVLGSLAEVGEFYFMCLCNRNICLSSYSFCVNFINSRHFI